jgi:hypothetical protein
LHAAERQELERVREEHAAAQWGAMLSMSTVGDMVDTSIVTSASTASNQVLGGQRWRRTKVPATSLSRGAPHPEPFAAGVLAPQALCDCKEFGGDLMVVQRHGQGATAKVCQEEATPAPPHVSNQPEQGTCGGTRQRQRLGCQSCGAGVRAKNDQKGGWALWQLSQEQRRSDEERRRTFSGTDDVNEDPGCAGGWPQLCAPPAQWLVGAHV